MCATTGPPLPFEAARQHSHHPNADLRPQGRGGRGERIPEAEIKPTHCIFLTLLAELRLKIYEYILHPAFNRQDVLLVGKRWDGSQWHCCGMETSERGRWRVVSEYQPTNHRTIFLSLSLQANSTGTSQAPVCRLHYTPQFSSPANKSMPKLLQSCITTSNSASKSFPPAKQP